MKVLAEICFLNKLRENSLSRPSNITSYLSCYKDRAICKENFKKLYRKARLSRDDKLFRNCNYLVSCIVSDERFAKKMLNIEFISINLLDTYKSFKFSNFNLNCDIKNTVRFKVEQNLKGFYL